MKKKITAILLFSILSVMLFTVGTLAQDVQKGGEIIITDLSFKDAKTLDPHVASAAGSMRYIENMYNTLLKYEKGSYGKIAKDLVKEYSISDDGQVYTFTLHEGIKFHNGDPLTSEDVKYSINRIIESEVRAAHFEAMEEFQIVDEQTFKIILNKPVAPFTTFLAYPMNAIVNKTVVEANDGNIDSVDAGSGPFKLVEWKKDQHLKLEKFADYFKEDLPYLDKVTLRPIPDETARTTALRNEEVDMILQVSPKEKMKLENQDGINVVSKPGTYWEYLGLNTTEGPLSNKKVRRAIAYTVDRDQLNKMVKFGEATPLTGGPIPPGHWAYPDLEMYTEPNLDKAKQLLSEAGYEDGFEAELIALPNKSQLDAAQIIKQQLAEIGISIEVRSLESGVYFDKLGSKDFDMTVIGWVGFVDPDEFLFNIFHTGEKWNQQGYSNEKVDELLEEGRRTIEREERKEIYEEAVRLIAEDAPMVFLYVNPQISAFVDEVKNFDVNPTVTTISLETTWLDR